MKTWRERIAEARAVGGFTDEDRALAARGDTCAVGEVTSGRHEWFTTKNFDRTCLSGRFTVAVKSDDFKTAEETLNAIEDAFLRLKREQVR